MGTALLAIYLEVSASFLALDVSETVASNAAEAAADAAVVALASTDAAMACAAAAAALALSAAFCALVDEVEAAVAAAWAAAADPNDWEAADTAAAAFDAMAERLLMSDATETMSFPGRT